MIISIEHGATLLPTNSPVIGSARSAPFSDDEVSGPPLFPDQGLPLTKRGLKLLGAVLTPSLPEPPVKSRRQAAIAHAQPHVHAPAHEPAYHPLAVSHAVAAPKDAGDPGNVDPGYDEAVEKLLWFLVVG